jgi:hypothetical protein
MGIEANTVAAAGQLEQDKQSYCVEQKGGRRVLFVGNSITRHGPKADIGWHGDWGMAASAEEKDYVHRTLHMIEDRWGKVDYCVLNAADWERGYWDDSILSRWQSAADFRADVVIIRVGENIWSVREHLNEIDLYPHFDKMIRFFCQKPEAQVILTDLFWKKEQIDGVIHRLAEDRGYALVRLGDLGDAEENMAHGLFEHRGVAHHPGDLGMERIAKRIVDQIRF